MEVNGYLPSHIRVFTDENGAYNPQILKEALHIEFEGMDKQKVLELKGENKDEELYRYLLICQCNALNKELPKMFDNIESFMELLFPDNILREGSVIEQMVTTIPEEDWKDQVQIIGWLYQYWNIEPKDTVFANLKKNIKITKENIPAATQLFTPDWIVRYMVENSLGRVWKETHKDFDTGIWKYYIEENNGHSELDSESQLENITFLDPCMGSGHILVYAFDVFMDLYKSMNYSPKDACESIIKNNIFGVDLDKRAWQLSYFALKMKARQYDSGFLRRGIEPNVFYMQDFEIPNNAELKAELKAFAESFRNADIYGSLTPVKKASQTVLNQIEEFNDGLLSQGAKNTLERMAKTAGVLDNKYSVVCTNPPYMGASGMNGILSDFVKNRYPDSKSDLSTCFMEYCEYLCSNNGYYVMINIPVWMFLSSYEKLREKISRKNTYINMLHFGRGIFGSDFGTTAFVIAKQKFENYKGAYRRLFEKQGAVDSVEQKEQWFFEKKGEYFADQKDFSKIPGSPVAYWLSKNYLKAFENKKLDELASPKQGIATADNNRFLRLWYELDTNRIAYNCSSTAESVKILKKWFPYNKGGDFRKWYGNNDYVVNWENDGYEIKHFYDEKGKLRSRPQNLDFIFKKCITWSKISIGAVAFRYKPNGHIFDVAGTSIFADENILNYLHGFCNSKVALSILSAISPTLNYEVGQIASLPIIENDEKKHLIDELVQQNIDLSKSDWDSFETSWDFTRHPLMPELPNQDVVNIGNNRESSVACDGDYLGHNIKIADTFKLWQKQCQSRFDTLKSNEEELNRIFIEIYGLQDELTPDVAEKDVTVRKADLERDVKSFISYAVGCMFGRYSISIEGLVYAGGESLCMDSYKPFDIDSDNVIPITDEEYFEDDITGRFAKFVEIVFGKETLSENLTFIANALGGNGREPKGVIRNYFINDFYKDHCKTYQNRPIYWLFDAGKKNSFKALIYMHRYQADTLAKIRTDYVHEQQSKYRAKIAELAQKAQTESSTSVRVKIEKELSKFREQDVELHSFEEKVNHLAAQMISIDLDDGVKVNYEKFSDVLAKMK